MIIERDNCSFLEWERISLNKFELLLSNIMVFFLEFKFFNNCLHEQTPWEVAPSKFLKPLFIFTCKD